MIGDITGYPSLDTFCLDGKCLNQLPFLLVDHTDNIQNYHGSGMIGLAPTNQGTGAKMFVPELYRQGLIPRSLFALFLHGGKHHSHLTLGGYDLNSYAKAGERITWLPILNTGLWEFRVSRIKLGSYHLST